MKSRLLVAALLLSSLALAQVPSPDWGVGVGGNSARFGQSAQVGPLGPSRAWTLGRSAVIAQQPMIEGDTVYMSRIFNLNNVQGGTDIVAQDLSTGTLRWQIQLPVDFAGDWRSRLTGVNNGVVYATRSGNTNSSFLYALRASDGSVIWRSQDRIDEASSESVAFAPNGDIIAGSLNNLRRIRATDGTTVWTASRLAPTSDATAAAIFNNTAYTWNQTGQGPEIVAFDLTSGARRYTTGGLLGLTQQTTLFVGPDGTVYAPRNQNNPNTDFLIALTDTGIGFVEKWRYATPNLPFASHAVGPDGTVYTYPRGGGAIVRLDPATGLEINRSPSFTADFFQPRIAVDASGLVYVTNGAFGDGRLLAYNADLSLRWSEPIRNVNQGGPALGQDGTLVVAGVGEDVRGYRDPVDSIAIGSFQVTRGAQEAGGLSSFLLSDDDRLSIQARAAASPATPSAQLVVEGQTADLRVRVFRFRAEARVTARPAGKVRQRIEIFDWEAARWVILDERDAPIADAVANGASADNPQRFIQTGTGLVRARLSWFDRGVAGVRWSAQIDSAGWGIVR